MRIPIEEVQFNAASQCDPNGRIFTWQGGLYRGMSKGGALLAKRLFDCGAVQSLVEKHLLVRTEQTSLQLDGFDLVLKHQRLPVVSYPFEWPGCLLKEALVLIAELQIELARHGF